MGTPTESECFDEEGCGQMPSADQVPVDTSIWGGLSTDVEAALAEVYADGVDRSSPGGSRGGSERLRRKRRWRR